MSFPKLSVNAELPKDETAPIGPGTPLSPGRTRESSWDRVQRITKDAETFHQRRRASSATEPPITLTSLADMVIRSRIQEEEDEKKEVEEEEAAESEKKKEAENKKAKKGRPNITVVAPTSPSSDKLGTPKEPNTPKSPRSPFKVSTAEPAEVPEDLKKNWSELRKHKADLSWVLFGFPDTKSRKVILLGSGKEGIEDLKPKLDHKVIQFGALRVEGADEHAKRSKFIGFAVVAPGLPPSQKLQAMHVKEIQRDLFTGIHTTVEVADSSELNEINITKKLLLLEKGLQSVDFGGGKVVQVSSLK